MIDKTTVGMTAEPDEVEAVLHNLCGYHLAERDPVFRYMVLTREQVLYDALVASIKRERGRALAELVASGTTMTQAAEMTNLTSRQQVQRLIAVAKAAEAAAVEVQAATAELQAAASNFEERMAAVEATLDEVVSGILPAPAQPSPEWETPDSPTPLGAVPAGVNWAGASVEAMVGATTGAAFETRPDASFETWADASFETRADASFETRFESSVESVADSVTQVPTEYVPDLYTDTSNGIPVVPGAAPVDAVVGEATQNVPTLATVIHPTREVQSDDARWWRRGRDTGAA